MKSVSRTARSARRHLGFPDGKRFAFTILDDTDDATLENVAPVYGLLRELGFRTTKTAWPLDCPEGSRLFFAAETLQNGHYLEFTRALIRDGFEFASHGATMESSTRERTIAGLDFLASELGTLPTLHCNHGQNAENLYWGAERYRSAALRLPMMLMDRLRGRRRYEGHVEGSQYFWGDIAKRQFKYVRNFAFATVNTARFEPVGPYRLRSTPFVNYWFNTSDAPDAAAFRRLLTKQSIDQLEQEGGVCILSTHLGKGFAARGKVDPVVEETLRYIAAKPGWFVPVSTVLDHLLTRAPAGAINKITQWRLEARHVLDRVRNP